MKILHAPRDDAGIATGLAIGERRLGHESTVVALYRGMAPTRREVGADLSGRSLPGRFAGHLAALFEHRTGYDVYNFLGGATFLHFPRRGVSLLDLPFIDRDAAVVFTFTGSDARPVLGHRSALLQSAIEESLGGRPTRRSLERRDAFRRRSIAKAARRAGHLFATNPDLLCELPEGASFLPYPLAAFDSIGDHPHRFFADDKVHIVHAPTQRALKGTRFVLEAIERLEGELGDRFRFSLVEGLPHDEALRRYAEADLLVDQLLVGWYGVVAAEAMRMGIPVVSFIDDDQLGAVPAEMAAALPVVRADPSNLAAVLRRLVVEREQLLDIGRRGRVYAEAWHDPTMVARQAVERYRRG